MPKALFPKENKVMKLRMLHSIGGYDADVTSPSQCDFKDTLPITLRMVYSFLRYLWVKSRKNGWPTYARIYLRLDDTFRKYEAASLSLKAGMIIQVHCVLHL